MITLSFEGLLWLCGVLVTISAAANVVSKAWSRVKSPNVIQDGKITALEQKSLKHEQMLDNDKRRLDAMDQQGRVMIKALLALLESAISGNNQKQCEDAKSELHDYLVGK